MNKEFSSCGHIHLHINGAIAEIEFFHPSANALPSHLLSQLIEVVNQISDDDSISILIFKSKGNVFCAGASFDELLSLKSETQSQSFFEGFARLLLAIKNSGKICIAKVQGKAVGGGVGILAACDYVMAVENAAIRLSELLIGIAPFVIAPALIRKMGVAAFNELFLTPDQWKSAYWANEKGLFSEVFSCEKELDERTDSFCQTLLQSSPSALRQMRKITWKDTQNWESELLENAKKTAKLALTPQVQQRLLKFKSK